MQYKIQNVNHEGCSAVLMGVAGGGLQTRRYPEPMGGLRALDHGPGMLALA
jgi:hypothetical protein